ncbi:D-alanyl-D-alanine carboxypeptidase [Phaeobacter sp. QD34_3]|uniref:D-alanyl-D-alanine carboxypeptidase family protein n=1 Tax=unclassified Phaeobacter TaxID=2621772 RepID=UPI00237F15FD|nr:MULTISPECIES: D-alanyl-D-alanine carboxypeptidase family protein [unclassified Phaeobacter]MDE4132556.1 D-alanyl-D-alanine carboxypeptidase [Phaeobacter sp. QD34_3]MDE4136193.1 D-alanyl-D-alanine carboxypeptidase [Phaeobacter sp. QD34_24]MDE4174445.1 D-alanyl-D-alanine carboxypeptidase [Phaeobacter sp. PT47_59]
MADIEQVRFHPVTFALGVMPRQVAWVLGVVLTVVLAGLAPPKALAAPYAAMVMDARTGEVLHSRNADTRLHPASLTKMMTLYIAFEAVRNGEITLDTKVRISSNAAAEQPSKLGLKSGQRIALRYLIRAAAVKSANDAATAIGEALSGSEAAFARRMTRTAKALGMSRTTFKNAHGLTESGHMSTARDMTTLGRHILYDYPEYYNLFSRKSADAGVRTVPNTNRRLLAAYKGADGIKTGYTRAAGFNLVASAKRGNERIIATVFGGKSSTSRNAKVAELLDLGFRRAPSQAKLRKPAVPTYVGNQNITVADNAPDGAAGKTIRVSGSVKTSLRPRLRPQVLEAPVLVAEAQTTSEDTAATDITDTIAATAPQRLDPEVLQASVQAAMAEAKVVPASAPAPTDVTTVNTVFKGLRPVPRPSHLTDAGSAAQPEPVVVTRLSTSGGRYWGINVGRYTSRYKAEKVLLRTALSEMETLNGTLRKVAKSKQGFEANFLGMTKEGAELACRRLNARNVSCETLGPAS